MVIIINFYSKNAHDKKDPSTVNSIRPAHEGEPLQHEVACLFYASSVGAPVLQTEIGKILKDVQTLAGWDVPVSVLLYFGEDPGLDESTSEEKKKTATKASRQTLE